MSTAYVKLEMELELKTSGKAAIVFQPLATSDFEGIVRDMEEVVKGTGEETGTTVTSTDDEFGYRWMILSDPDMEDLVVGVNAVSTAIQGGGYGDRVLCAVFALPRQRAASPSTGSTTTSAARFYPFVPAGGAQQRDHERELRLKAQVGADLPVEPELERWFPSGESRFRAPPHPDLRLGDDDEPRRSVVSGLALEASRRPWRRRSRRARASAAAPWRV